MTVPLEPAAPARRKAERGVWPAEGVKIPPKLVRFSQIAPGTTVLPLPGTSKSALPVMSPATSRLPIGSLPVTISLFTPSFPSALTVAAKTLLRVVVRTSELVTK